MQSSEAFTSVSRNRWYGFAEPRGSEEPTLENVVFKFSGYGTGAQTFKKV